MTAESPNIREIEGACRVCGQGPVHVVARVQPYLDYETVLADCLACGCRFAPHDPDVHERLHANHSSYDSHSEQCDAAAALFAAREVQALRSFLSITPKYRFVIDFIDQRPRIARVAEIGCSRGQLSAYFIATDRDVRAFDISPTAVARATETFGPHFHVMNDNEFISRGPYDAVFHVGTIGCVSDPISMTHFLLSAVKPGGWLVFNAPVREHLTQTGTLWPGTPPPDLVTVFPAAFWPQMFGSVAHVEVSLARCSVYERIAFPRAAVRAMRPTKPLVTSGLPPRSSTSTRSRVRWIYKALATVLHRIPTSVPQPYGAHVVMQKS